MSNLIGQFYFKRTDNGNLLGEFSNQHSLIPSTESADLIFDAENISSDFTGTYNSAWQEDDKARIALLTITRKPQSQTIYLLRWDMKTEPTFWGEGFLVDKILIGHYRNFEKT